MITTTQIRKHKHWRDTYRQIQKVPINQWKRKPNSFIYCMLVACLCLCVCLFLLFLLLLCLPNNVLLALTNTKKTLILILSYIAPLNESPVYFSLSYLRSLPPTHTHLLKRGLTKSLFKLYSTPAFYSLLSSFIYFFLFFY